MPGSCGGSAPKRYVKATLSKFQRAYACLSPKSRHAYEVIDSERPCFAYFDLEFKRQEGVLSLADGPSLAKQVADAAVRIIRDRYAAAQQIAGKDLEIDAVFLDSSRESKFSQHVVLRSYSADLNGRRTLAPLSGLAIAKQVAVNTVDVLEGENEKSVIDLAVYTQNRCFRLAGSSKLGAGVPLRLVRRLRYGKNMSCCDLGLPCESDLQETIVVPEIDANDVDILDVSVPPPTLRPKEEATAPSDSFSSSSGQPSQMLQEGLTVRQNSWLDSWRGATTRPLLDLADVKHSYVRCRRKGLGCPPEPFTQLACWALNMARRKLPAVACPDNIDAYNWMYVWADYPTERYLHLTIKGTRYCYARGRQHKQQHIILSIDLQDGTAWQRCWDREDCIVRAQATNGNNVRLRAKHPVDQVPAGVIPKIVDLAVFEMKDRRLALEGGDTVSHCSSMLQEREDNLLCHSTDIDSSWCCTNLRDFQPGGHFLRQGSDETRERCGVNAREA